MEHPDKKQLTVKLILLALFLGAVIFVSVRYAPFILHIISNTGRLKAYIDSFGETGILVFILINVAHIIIVVIPGELLQVGGGYIYGTFWGTLYVTIGMFIGIVIVFFSTRIFGYSVVGLFMPKKHLEKFHYIINDPKSEIIMFILFLIPGIPKDALTYLAGLTPIKPVKFLAICTMARLPGVLGSCYIGANLQRGNYTAVFIVSGIAVVSFVLGVIYQKKLVDFLHNLRKKPSQDK